MVHQPIGVRILFVAFAVLLSIASATVTAAAHTVAHTAASPPPSSLPPLRIGIIGGGISGSSIGHWLHDSSLTRSFELELTLLEREDRLGGRLQDTHILGHRFENGASILHESNEYAKNFVRLLNLTFERPPSKMNQRMSIWDGSKFVLELGSSRLWGAETFLDIIKLVWRYGENFFRLRGHIRNVAERFHTIYQRQSEGESFEGPQQLLKQLELYEFTQTSFRESFRKTLHDQFVLDELGEATVRVNYGQSVAKVNALAGAVALTPLIDANLFAVKDGNKKLVEGLIDLHRVRALKRHRVRTIERTQTTQASGRPEYIVTAEVDGKNQSYTFDIVVLATPFEQSGIEFRIPSTPPGSPPSSPASTSSFQPQPERMVRQFQVTHTTWIEGVLNHTSFGFPSSEDLPGMILTTESDQHEFTSITAYAEDADTGKRIYKIFSRHPFDDRLISKYFLDVTPGSIQRTDWKAYPTYSPPERFSNSFQLYPSEQIWYPLALEHAASCVEMQLVSARNTALRIAEEWKEHAKVQAQTSRTHAPAKDEL